MPFQFQFNRPRRVRIKAWLAKAREPVMHFTLGVLLAGFLTYLSWVNFQ